MLTSDLMPAITIGVAISTAITIITGRPILRKLSIYSNPSFCMCTVHGRRKYSDKRSFVVY